MSSGPVKRSSPSRRTALTPGGMENGADSSSSQPAMKRRVPTVCIALSMLVLGVMIGMGVGPSLSSSGATDARRLATADTSCFYVDQIANRQWVATVQNIASPLACQTSCQGNAKCHWFVYKASTKECVLKDNTLKTGATPFSKTAGFTSGPKAACGATTKATTTTKAPAVTTKAAPVTTTTKAPAAVVTTTTKAAVKTDLPSIQAACKALVDKLATLTAAAGTVVTPYSDTYEEDRTAHGEATGYLGYKPRPCVIFFVKTEQHVVNAVQWAKTTGSTVVARSGRHDFLGHSSNDMGVVIDVSLMMDARWEGTNAVVQPGLRNQEVYNFVSLNKRIVPSGLSVGVSIGGISGGGGWGKMHRAFGTTADHIIAARVVTADGKVTVTNENENPELLWALKGAGHTNFGITTELTFRTHPDVKFAQVSVMLPHAEYTPKQRKQALRILQNAFDIQEVEDRVHLDLTIQRTVPGADGYMHFNWWIVGGTVAELKAAIPKDLITLAGTHVRSRSFASFRDAFPVWAHCSGAGTIESCLLDNRTPISSRLSFSRIMESKSGFFAKLDTAAIDHLVKNTATAFVRLLGGQHNRTPITDSAYPHRTAMWVVEFFFFRTGLGCYGECPALQKYLDDAFTLTFRRPNAVKRVYVNYPIGLLKKEEYPTAYWGENYPRLQQIKLKYDKDMMFTDPQGVKIPGA